MKSDAAPRERTQSNSRAMPRLIVTTLVAVGLACAAASGGTVADGADGDAATPAFDPSLIEAQVTFVEVEVDRSGVLHIATTIRHDDEGWDHYADGWQIVDPDSGEVLAERVLMHPHVDEQPFTRSLRDVDLPEGLDRFVVRARCTVHAFGGREILVDLREDSGPGFVVLR